MGERRPQLPGSLTSHREQDREMPMAPSTHGGGPWLTRRCSELAFLYLQGPHGFPSVPLNHLNIY